MKSRTSRHRFTEIFIQGFRRLVDVSVPMRDLTVMIGGNGAGKTSFLEVWSLLGSSAAGRLGIALDSKGGIDDVLTRDLAEDIVLRLTGDSEGSDYRNRIEYSLRLRPTAQAYSIPEESLRGYRFEGETISNVVPYIEASGPDIRYYPEGSEVIRPTWEFTPYETSLSQAPRPFAAAEAFRRRLSDCRCYAAGVLDVSAGAAIRRPQHLTPVTSPSSGGENLVSYLYNLRESDRDRFEVLTDTIAAAFRDFERLDFPPVAAGMLAMTWKDKNFSRPLYTHQLSEGTLRFLWLASLLLSGEQASITLIDEPEISLHPELLSLLVDLMRGVASRTQLIVATQSDRLIRFLKPEEVLVVDLAEGNPGSSSFRWADSMDIEHWLADFTLDQLHEMGQIGGRP